MEHFSPKSTIEDFGNPHLQRLFSIQAHDNAAVNVAVVIALRTAMIRIRDPIGPQAPNGFTLIELLVVIAIIGILIAIAIPQFNAYKKRAVDEQMIWDLKNAAVAMESYFADKRVYTSSVSDVQAVGFRQTVGVTLTITVTSPSSYTMIAAKPAGTKPSYSYNSTTGLIQ